MFIISYRYIFLPCLRVLKALTACPSDKKLLTWRYVWNIHWMIFKEETEFLGVNALGLPHTLQELVLNLTRFSAVKGLRLTA